MKRLLPITLIIAITTLMTSCHSGERQYRVKTILYSTSTGYFQSKEMRLDWKDKSFKIGDTTATSDYDRTYAIFDVIIDTLQ